MRTTLLFLLALAAPVGAQTIDFESFPGGGSPADKQAIDTQYASLGVTFALIARCTIQGQPDDPKLCLPPTILPNRSPKIAVVGPPLTAFTGVDLGSGCADQPQASAGVGTRFLTDDAVSGLRGNLLISYSAPVEAASGDILDIDTRPGDPFEQWTVLALDQDWRVVDEVVLRAVDGQDPSQACQGGHGPGDGAASHWLVESPQNLFEIHHILLAYTGSRGLVDNVGLAFDNFSPSVDVCTDRWERFGASCRGSAVLDGSGCLAPGKKVRLRISGGAPNASTCLFVASSRSSVPFAGCTLYLGGSLLFYEAILLDGAGGFAREYPLPLQLVGSEFFFQAVYSQPGGAAFTNGLKGLAVP